MTIDEAILKALQGGGPVTVDAILKRFEAPVRGKLEKLRVRGVVMREGRGGPHRRFTFTLLRPDRAAKALGEKGGRLRAPANAASDVRPPAQGEGAQKRRRVFLKRSGYHFHSRRKQEKS
jgi:hypothetical protein